MVGVGHHVLLERQLIAGCADVQLEIDEQAVALESVHETLDSGSVRRPAEPRVDTVDAEPAVLVQRHPDDVGRPRLHRRDGRCVGRSVEDPPALGAGILGARAVQPDQLEHDAVGVDEMATFDVYDVRQAPDAVEAGRRRRRGRCHRPGSENYHTGGNSQRRTHTHRNQARAVRAQAEVPWGPDPAGSAGTSR